MPKIKLGNRPKSFPHDLTVPMLDGTDGEMTVHYVYRTRKEFAAFVDAHMEAVKAAAEAELAAEKAKIEADKAASIDQVADGIKLPVAESLLSGRVMESQTNFIMGAVQGWNLDIPFDREAVEELVSELPRVAAAIIQTYRTAMIEGRLGN